MSRHYSSRSYGGYGSSRRRTGADRFGILTFFLLLISSGFLAARLLTTGGELIFSLEEDASSTAPLSLRAWNGEQVTFTVTWDKEVGAK